MSEESHHRASARPSTVPPTTTANRRAGDLSRRVVRRRAELGLSLEEVARQTGIDPGYLNYLEQHADVRLSGGSLMLLSMALKTTPEVLLGGHPCVPSDRVASGPHPDVEPLTVEQCEMHLGMAVIGRLVYARARGPVAIPVNYEYAHGQILVSTDPEKAAWLEGVRIVGFEVDRVDEGMSEGWSVTVTGEARAVEDPEEKERLLAASRLDSWSDGRVHTLVAITPKEITGRVIVHHGPW